MPLLEVEYIPPVVSEEPARPILTGEQVAELAKALSALGHEVLRTTCKLGGDLRNKQYEWVGGYSLHAAYHLQEGLPKDHEIAVWSEYNDGRVKFYQQLVRWDGDERDVEVYLTAPIEVVTREPGSADSALVTLGAIAGLNPQSPHEDVMNAVRDAHDTVIFFARAMGYEPRPIGQ